MSKLKDLTGERFGRWTVTAFEGHNTRNERIWTCRCECGSVRGVLGKSLSSGKSTGCGCVVIGRRQDIGGQTFGRLTVIRFDHMDSAGKAKWLCECECGNECIVRSNGLISGNTRSCGCLSFENRQEIGRKYGPANACKMGYANRTHGQSQQRTPAYETWLAMRARCLNKNHHAYHNYGGRGITICPEWGSFENFFADMGARPKELSIDRIDNEGNYEPGNCHWATPKEQNNNQRRNKKKI